MQQQWEVERFTWAAQYSSSPAMVSVFGCGWKVIFSCQSTPNSEVLRQGFVQVIAGDRPVRD